MPLFFFDFTLNGAFEPDDIGTEFPSLEMAYLDVCRTALDLSFEKLRGRSDPNLDLVDILDADRQPLMQVPFSDVLHPKPSHRRAPQTPCSDIFDSCQKEMARGKRLHAEIVGEVRKIESVSSAIRANLARLRETDGSSAALPTPC